ncbi:MAG: hypothetical protein HBSAPP03_19530 [Phycisphaerae bacterium]|nr:MAG: hypothetical protein HBSAPP03_19530 [Phycisphaerae bacterium]
MAAALAVFHALALAQPDPSGIDFVTIGAPGNAAWDGTGITPDGDPRVIGRGSVGYEYRIGRTEVTTAQWVEFFNAAYDRPQSDWLPHLFPPDHWGAVSTTPNTPGGRRWSVPAGNEMRAVGDISWRMAAMYCNWLHNDKSLDRTAFLNGAYDVSTFGFQGTFFTDQLTHHPSAKFWVPTLDEWLKAVHFDPNANAGQGRWWLYPNGTDQRLAYGPPGVRARTEFPLGPDPNGILAQANGGWDSQDFPGYNPFTVPLGAYPDATSPFGLLDVAGGTREWTEYVFLTNGTWPTGRGFDGSAWTTGFGLDRIYAPGGDFPNTATFDYGFRVASAVPSAGACFSLATYGIFWLGSRTRKGVTHEGR